MVYESADGSNVLGEFLKNQKTIFLAFEMEPPVFEGRIFVLICAQKKISL